MHYKFFLNERGIKLNEKCKLNIDYNTKESYELDYKTSDS
jgi:hypothetical protein